MNSAIALTIDDEIQCRALIMVDAKNNSDAGYKAANDKIMQNMMKPMSGNPDKDFVMMMMMMLHHQAHAQSAVSTLINQRTMAMEADCR